MSGFDPSWLDLREPADHRARNADVLATCAAHFGSRDDLRVVDLGCGSGSNLRALAPHLPARQDWRLVDDDAAMLGAARDRLARWAEAAEEIADGGLRLRHSGRDIAVAFVRADLSYGADSVITDVDLVTAAALFDLVSEKWLERFVRGLADARTSFYTALTYNGLETWTPPDPHDAAMLAAFHAHQARDKGFGPSTGPRASETLARLLTAQDYIVSEGDSAWRLTRENGPLIAALAEGVAAACADTGLVNADDVGAWLQARRTGTAEIGHTDLFARPA